MECAKAKKTVSSSIPEILLETNNWTFLCSIFTCSKPSVSQGTSAPDTRQPEKDALKHRTPLSVPQCKSSGHHEKWSHVFLSAFLFYPLKATEVTAGAPGELTGRLCCFQHERTALFRAGEVTKGRSETLWSSCIIQKRFR